MAEETDIRDQHIADLKAAVRHLVMVMNTIDRASQKHCECDVRAKYSVQHPVVMKVMRIAHEK